MKCEVRPLLSHPSPFTLHSMSKQEAKHTKTDLVIDGNMYSKLTNYLDIFFFFYKKKTPGDCFKSSNNSIQKWLCCIQLFSYLFLAKITLPHVVSARRTICNRKDSFPPGQSPAAAEHYRYLVVIRAASGASFLITF